LFISLFKVSQDLGISILQGFVLSGVVGSFDLKLPFVGIELCVLFDYPFSLAVIEKLEEIVVFVFFGFELVFVLSLDPFFLLEEGLVVPGPIFTQLFQTLFQRVQFIPAC
jgi:hypothetical protein